MPDRNEQIGALVRRGILLLSTYVSIPAPAVIAGIAAATISKVLALHDRRVETVLSAELTLSHISGVQPDDEQVILFFARNPVYPELESEFDTEIRGKDIDRLRELYPVVHSALILRRQIPALLYHAEMESRRYRSMALQYEELIHGYTAVQQTEDLQTETTGFIGDLLGLLEEAYGAFRKESKDKRFEKAFEVIDLVQESAHI